ncbi:MAG: hypothetical protein EZS28_019140 [Streblomastix strix]|uniref:Uncharacterized protein n=1 Tax=Streblomastix strix TaxID=222440 RepID=A0A5J4VSM7_9EUKA|nr:MAG: hypothetical protein EZS28_019140 [Streblomastix strix]
MRHVKDIRKDPCYHQTPSNDEFHHDFNPEIAIAEDQKKQSQKSRRRRPKSICISVKFADKEAQIQKSKNMTAKNFSFEFDPRMGQYRELKLELLDQDTFGKDDQIGKADMPV